MAGLENPQTYLASRNGMTNALKGVYQSTKYSDLTIFVDGQSFKLHKLVICEQSPKLRVMCEGKDEITLEPIDGLKYPQAYEAMSRFMYGLEYDENKPPSSSDRMGFYSDVLRVACTYGCVPLEELAFEEVDDATISDWNKDEFLRSLGHDMFYDDDSIFEYLIETCNYRINELHTDSKFRGILERRTKLAVRLAYRFGRHQIKFCCDECGQAWMLNSCFFSSPSFCPSCGHKTEDWRDFLY
ncbi:BTB/POZ [Penicillium occitanis (nom. inval.)]|nr:hypothetical protein PENOC_035530 [Penicillium occitanis (nom. inval.)]PCH05005.1 BTB/POZ [Penicillium occitanis (nom. inval.)]